MTKKLMMMAVVAVGNTGSLSGSLDLTGIRGIGDSAFSGCSGLMSVTIPNSVTSIGEHAFYGCSASLFDTTTIAGVKLVDGWAVGNTGSLSGSLDLTGVRGIADSAFSGCGGLTNVTISSNITCIATTAFDGCNKLWTAWYRTLANSSASDGISHSVVTTVVQQVVTTIVQQVESPYTLTDHAADRAIASLTVDADCAIDEFVLKNGEVYDSMLRIVNAADHEVRLTLPAGYVYETFKGVKPLTIPANSRNILTITRTKADTFLVSREELETVQ